MPGFLYYLPGFVRQAVSPAELKAFGLDYAIPTEHPGTSCSRTSKGPDDAEGLVFTFNRDKIPPRFLPDDQLWIQSADGQFWVGVARSHRPGPADLAHAKTYEGKSVTLLDGNPWIIPRCYAVIPDQTATLPMVIGLSADRKSPIGRIHPKYAALNDAAFQFWLNYAGRAADDQKMNAADQLAAVILALGANYRLGTLEAVELLGLFSTDEMGQVLRAMIDADEIDRYLKTLMSEKKQSD